MTKGVAIKWGLGAVMVGLLGFTVHYVMKQIQLLVNTEFTSVGTQINKINFSEINITLWWKVVNKSDIGLTLTNQIYDVYLNGKFVKKVGSSIPVTISPHADTRIPTYVVFTPKELLKVGFLNFANLLTKEGRSKTVMEVKGSIDMKTSVFSVKNFPFEYADDMESMMVG
jgi:LEA14-like dessication related protein